MISLVEGVMVGDESKQYKWVCCDHSYQLAVVAGLC